MAARDGRNGTDRSTLLIILLTVILVLQAGVLLVHRYVISGDEEEETGDAIESGTDLTEVPPDWELVSSGPVTYTFNDGATVEAEGEISLWFPPCEPAWEDTVLIYRLHDLEGADPDGEVFRTYTVEFSSGRQPSRPLQVELSFASELEEGRIAPSDNVYVVYNSDDTGAWEEVPALLDLESGTATFYTDHFSGYGIRTERSAPGPTMVINRWIRDPMNTAAQPDSALSRQILETLSATQEPGQNAISTGLAVIDEAFGVTAAGASFSQEVAGLSIAERFNDISGEIGVVLALAKFGLEIFEGDDRSGILNLSSSLLQYSLGKWGWQGLKIANIGIFIINYSLTEFATEALSVREEVWRNRYREYNSTHNPHRMDQQRWADFIVDRILNSRSFQADIEGKLNLYLYDYFSEAGAACPDDVIAVLVAEEKVRMSEMLSQTVDGVMQEVAYQRNLQLHQHLREVGNLMNERGTILVCVYGDTLEDPRVRNLPVRIPVSEDQHLWQGSTDDAGQWWFNLTWLGYLHYGKPGTVELEYQGRTITEELSFDRSNQATVRIYLDQMDQDTSIHVTSEPSGATVYLDGANTGQLTPAEISEFQPGTHSLRVFLEGYNEFVTTFDIAQGESHRVHADLGEPQPPLPVFSVDLEDGQTFTDNVILVSGTISLVDGEGNTSPFQGTSAILTLNGSDRETAVQGGRFDVELSIPSGRSVISLRANGPNGDTGVSGPISINGDFSVPGIEITLIWNSPTSDLDLHVYNPEMEHSFWQSPAISDGSLDIDDVEGYGPETFTAENAISGSYMIQVNCFSMDEDTYSDATVTVHVNGQLQGTYGPYRFSYGDGMSGDPAAWWDVATIEVR